MNEIVAQILEPKNTICKSALFEKQKTLITRYLLKSKRYHLIENFFHE